MKVVQVLFSGLGGHGSVVFSMLKADIHKQWNTSLLFYGIEPLKEEYKQQCEKENIPYAYVTKNGGADFKSYFKVFDFLKKEKPEVILVHSSNLLPVILLYRSFYRTKVFLVEHTANDQKTMYEWFCSFLGTLFAHSVVYLTEVYREEIRQRFKLIFRANKVTLIPNGIDTNYFKPGIRDQKPYDLFYISMVARFSKTKAQDELVEAMHMIRKEHPQINLLLTLAGDGENFEYVKQKAKALNLMDCIQFTGKIDEERVMHILQQTDLYVHATHHETMSTSIMQAMACGLPVMTSKITGVQHMVREGENGILFPPSQPEELSKSICEMIRNKPKRTALGNQARAYALQHFSHVSMFEKYNQLINRGL
jgi:glycosyltransferase involved in cell wall biosynthesis